MRPLARIAGPLGIVLAFVCCPGDEEPAIAYLRDATGEVTVKQDEAAEPHAAVKDQALSEGSVVTTGTSGSAIVEFQGGNRVSLQSSTSLVIRKTGSSAAQFGAILLSGSAKASSTGQGVLLAIGTPFGITKMGAGEGAVEVSVDGLRVVLGDVAFVGQDGNEERLGAGDTIAVNLGVITVTRLDTAHGGPLVLDPMQLVVFANPKQVQVRRKGETRWRTPKKRDVVNPGDEIRTRRATRTIVQFPERGRAVLRRGTELRFENVGDSAEAHRAKYALTSGTLELNLENDEGVDSYHAVDVAGTMMKIHPGAKQAAVEVASDADGSARVTVRSGTVELGDTVLEAGSLVDIEHGEMAGEPRPLADTRVDLRPHSNSIIYHLGVVPPIWFRWDTEDGADKYEVQIAKDRNFNDIVVDEIVGENRYINDRLGPGKYHWRVKGKGEWLKGTLSIERGRNSGIKYPRHNFIDDTGEKTKLFYQKTLPSITFRWPEAAGASKYRVKVYADGDFEEPLIDKQVQTTTAGFSGGRLTEGKYYWQVLASSVDGKDIRLGSMNTLEIAYDNAIVDLQIKAPRNNQRVSSRSIVTHGEVELGARLTINDKRAKLDAKGRFRETVALDKGGNQIVYRTISSDGIVRFHVRNVIRR